MKYRKFRLCYPSRRVVSKFRFINSWPLLPPPPLLPVSHKNFVEIYEARVGTNCPRGSRNVPLIEDSSFRGKSLFARVVGRSPKNDDPAVKNETSRGRCVPDRSLQRAFFFYTFSLFLSLSLSICRPITIFVLPAVSSQSPRLFIDEKHLARGGKYLTSKRGDQVGVCSNRRQIQFITGCTQSGRATRLIPAENTNR